MNLRDEILSEHTVIQRDKIIAWVGHSQKRFDELFLLFLDDIIKIAQRAAWPIGLLGLSQPQLMQKHWAKFIGNLQRHGIHDSTKRNSLKILQEIAIPEKFEGELMHICFGFVESVTEAIAVRTFALTILGRFTRQYPEIIPEIRLLINSGAEHQSPAFRNRAEKLLKSFESTGNRARPQQRNMIT